MYDRQVITQTAEHVMSLGPSAASQQGAEAGKHGGANAVLERCHLAFPTKVAPMMRRCGPFGFGAMMEPWISFFVNEDALKRIEPRMQPNESGLLNAFDSHRDLIYAAAAKAYRRGRKGSYGLTAADF
jgi:hypothetical protein